jgi:hypothetical protein
MRLCSRCSMRSLQGNKRRQLRRAVVSAKCSRKWYLAKTRIRTFDLKPEGKNRREAASGGRSSTPITEYKIALSLRHEPPSAG